MAIPHPYDPPYYSLPSIPHLDHAGYDEPNATNTLLVSGLPNNVMANEIQDLFIRYPGFDSCEIKCTGIGNQVVAYANFVNPSSAMDALYDLNGMKFDGSTLHVELAEPISRRTNKPVTARLEHFETVKELLECKMTEGTSVSSHVLKMKGYMDQLKRLGSPISDEFATDLILISLPESYDEFRLNFLMNNWEMSVSHLLMVLKIVEKNKKDKSSRALMVREGRVMKPQAKGKAKGKSKKAVVVNQGCKTKETCVVGKAVVKAPPPEERQCFGCNKTGHWRRNCPDYLANLKKKALGESTSSGPSEEQYCFECNKTGHWRRDCPDYLTKLKKKSLGEDTSSAPPEEQHCFECNKRGHWRRNCPYYLAKLKKKSLGEGTSSGD